MTAGRFLYFQPVVESLEFFLHVSKKTHVCRNLQQLVHILLPPPQALNTIYVRLYTYSTLEHEHIVSVDTLNFYLEQKKGLQNAI